MVEIMWIEYRCLVESGCSVPGVLFKFDLKSVNNPQPDYRVGGKEKENRT